MHDAAIDLTTTPIHLGLGATAVPQETFTGEMSWYERYATRNDADGSEGRLVTLASFRSPWPHWEMHPTGSEVVLCTAGQLTLHQELLDGTTRTVTLLPGQAVINAPGVWHTADTDGATALFITSGLGTQHRAR
jgi:quercetin dioxygenase-like cupin family protein